MIKKVLIVCLILGLAGLFGITFFARRAPVLLKNSIERAFNSEVSIQQVDYFFPWKFELKGFEIRESREPFGGDVVLSIDALTMHVSPISLSKKKLVIEDLEAEGVRLVIREWYGRLFHPFGDVLKRRPHGDEAIPDRLPQSPAQMVPMGLEIHELRLRDSQFQFLDYGIQENGFVVTFSGIRGKIQNLVLPGSDRKTSFDLEANIAQGRSQTPARAHVKGWARLARQNLEAALSIEKLHLPYFRPYYRKITQSSVEEGLLDLKAMARVEHQYLNADIGLEFNNLHFESYEDGGLLFDLKAEEILNFLKDSSGKLKLEMPVRWELSGRSERFSRVLRKGIEQSLKKTLLGNISRVLESVFSKGPDKNLGSLFKT